VNETLDNAHSADARVRAFWQAFCAATGVAPATPYQAWHFGNSAEMAHRLAELVIHGPKRATAALAWTNEKYPQAAAVLGGYSVVTEFDGSPRAVIRTTWLDTRPFAAVDRLFAWDEGEGDRTLADWKQGHWEFFSHECAALGRTPSEDMPVVLERFELLWPLRSVPTLQLARCTLRQWALEDWPALMKYAGNRAVQRNMYDLFPHPYTERDAREWAGGRWRHAGSAWAIEVAGEAGSEAVGGCGITPDSKPCSCSAEFGYWLGEPFWGRGIATEVAGALADYALKLHGITRVYATVHTDNPASMRVLEKNGFMREGLLAASALKDGTPIDRVMYAKVRADRSWP
jgi:RimJ/RimL family protein N-acetyltransferase